MGNARDEVKEAADYVTGQIVAPNGGRRMLV